MRALGLATAVLGLLAAVVPARGSDDPVLARVELSGPVGSLGLPVRAHLADRNGCPYALVVASRSRLDASGAAYEVLASGAQDAGYGLLASHGRPARAEAAAGIRLRQGGSEPADGRLLIPLDRDLVLSPQVIPVLPGQTWNAQVAEMVASVRPGNLASWEARLTGEEPAVVGGLPVTFLSRNTRSGEEIDAATQYVSDELRSMGLDVHFEPWDAYFAAGRNVVAELAGGARATEILLVTAHVDDMPAGGPAPGADDNASGVTGLLEVARVLQGHRFERTIRFVVTTGEEQGLYGSRAYASLLTARHEDAVAVLNLDMIAWDSTGGPVVNLHTRLPGNPGYAADTAVANLFQDVVGWYGLSRVLSPRIVSDGEIASDHSSFWAAGIPGILAIEDDLDDFDPAYHSIYDRAFRLNFEYFANLVRATAGTVAHLAGAPTSGERSFVVPVILSAPGAGGSYFSSQLAVTNHGTAGATVTYRYTASAGGGTGSATESLGAGIQKIIPDAIEFLRSTGLPIAADGARIGTLRVSFEGLASAADAGLLVRTATPIPPWPPVRGRAGLAYRGVPLSGLPDGPVALAALRQDATDRSNVAVLNAGTEAPVTLRLAFVEGTSGSVQGEIETTLDPGAFEQFRLTEIAPSAAGKDGWVRVERVTGGLSWYAYGVLNDQVTSDGSFVAPAGAASFPSAKTVPEMILPVVVEAGGFTTEVTATNVSNGARDLLLTFSSRAVLTPTNSASVKLHLESGEQRVIPDFVAALRASGAPGFAGANPLPFVGPLAVSVPDGTADGIVVTGRTLNPAGASPGQGRFGVAYGGVRSEEASVGPVFLLGLQQDDLCRTNLSIVNVGPLQGGDIAVLVELFDGGTGLKAGELVQTVPARQLVQLDGVLSLVPNSPRQGYARVTRLSGTGRFIAYAVVNDGASPGEGSGDGAYVASDPGS